MIGDRLVILPYDAVATRALFSQRLWFLIWAAASLCLALQFSFHYQGSCLSLALMLFAVLAVHELAGKPGADRFSDAPPRSPDGSAAQPIRRYNLALVLLILAVILAGLLFYRPIGTALFLGELLRQAAALVLRGILYLMSLFSSDESTGEDSAMGQQEICLTDGENTGGNSDWILVILLLLIVGLAVWKRRVI